MGKSTTLPPARRRRKFTRARRPEEKEVRRQQILTAARTLLAERGVSELSLNELARRSRVSKPNVYRYFESREDVLLQLWVDEVRELGERLERAFAFERDLSRRLSVLIEGLRRAPYVTARAC
jgi:AcrR family transcriptional regulator